MSIYTVFCETLASLALPCEAWLCCSEGLPVPAGILHRCISSGADLFSEGNGWQTSLQVVMDRAVDVELRQK